MSIILFQCSQTEKELGNDSILQLDAILSTIHQVDKHIVYGAWDSTINIYDLEMQTNTFVKKTATKCYAKPQLKDTRIYYPHSENLFVCITIDDQAPIWELNIQGRCDRFDFINDTIILASIKHYGIIGINAKLGEIIYEIRYNYLETLSPELSPWPVSFDQENFYVSNWQGHTLSSFSKKDGNLNWHFDSQEHSSAGQSIVLEDGKIFVGFNQFYKGGGFSVLHPNNGATYFNDSCSFEAAMIPILHDNSVYYYTYDETLERYDHTRSEVTEITRFEEGYDISGRQMYKLNNKIFVMNQSWNVTSYSLPSHDFQKWGRFGRFLLEVASYQDKIYFIFPD